MKGNILIKKLLTTATLGLMLTSASGAEEMGVNSEFTVSTNKEVNFLTTYKVNDWATIGYEFDYAFGDSGESRLSRLLDIKRYNNLSNFFKKIKSHSIITNFKYDKRDDLNFIFEAKFKFVKEGKLSFIYDYSNESYTRIFKTGLRYNVLNLDGIVDIHTIIGNAILGGSYSFIDGVGLEIGLNKSCNNRASGVCGYTSFLTQYSPVYKIPKFTNKNKLSYISPDDVMEVSLTVSNYLRWPVNPNQRAIQNTRGSIVRFDISATPAVSLKVNENVDLNTECTISAKEYPVCSFGLNINL